MDSSCSMDSHNSQGQYLENSLLPCDAFDQDWPLDWWLSAWKRTCWEMFSIEDAYLNKSTSTLLNEEHPYEDEARDLRMALRLSSPSFTASQPTVENAIRLEQLIRWIEAFFEPRVYLAMNELGDTLDCIPLRVIAQLTKLCARDLSRIIFKCVAVMEASIRMVPQHIDDNMGGVITPPTPVQISPVSERMDAITPSTPDQTSPVSERMGDITPLTPELMSPVSDGMPDLCSPSSAADSNSVPPTPADDKQGPAFTLSIYEDDGTVVGGCPYEGTGNWKSVSQKMPSARDLVRMGSQFARTVSRRSFHRLTHQPSDLVAP